MRYSWPGNLPQPENAVQRMAVLPEGNEISAQELPSHVLMHDAPAEENSQKLTLDEERHRSGRGSFGPCRNGHVQARAARELGITTPQLAYEIEKYDVGVRGGATTGACADCEGRGV